MKAGEPSRTAEYMALFRAMESSRVHDRLFDDPFAPLFLRRLLGLIFRLSRVPVLRRLTPFLIDIGAPGSRSSAIARTRLIDDSLYAALADLVHQVVVLGAGFDCRAYRIRGIEHTSVFEVDHPDTLEMKRRRLAAILPSVPSHVRFVATDFNQARLEDTMAGAGYDPARHTCFLWEGVTNYLTDAAVDAVFRWFARSAGGSHVIFTYVHSRVLREPEAFYGAKRVIRRVRRLGEPWTFGFEPGELKQYLAIRGLRLTSDVGATEYRAQYMVERRDGMSGYEFYRVASARVIADAA